jgi:hypothetical protein
MADRDSWIASRAYGIWEQEGRPDGDGDRHWLQAAEEFDARERTKASGDGAEVVKRSATTRSRRKS